MNNEEGVELKVVIVIIMAIIFIGVLYKKTHENQLPQKKEEVKVEKKEEVKVEKKAEGLAPLEQLMPKFEIVTNSTTSYQIRFMAHDKTNWDCVGTVFSNALDAAMVIDSTMLELKIKYEVGKAIADAFRASK